MDKNQDTSEKSAAEAAVFAAAVLPLVHHCNTNDAKTIYTNTRVGRTTTSFDDVKKAFENNYECMGITCADVGGLVGPEGDYFEGAGPCGGDIKPFTMAETFDDYSMGSSDKHSTGTKIGIAVACVAVLALVSLSFTKFWGSGKS